MYSIYIGQTRGLFTVKIKKAMKTYLCLFLILATASARRGGGGGKPSPSTAAPTEAPTAAPTTESPTETTTGSVSEVGLPSFQLVASLESSNFFYRGKKS